MDDDACDFCPKRYFDMFMVLQECHTCLVRPAVVSELRHSDLNGSENVAAEIMQAILEYAKQSLSTPSRAAPALHDVDRNVDRPIAKLI